MTMTDISTADLLKELNELREEKGLKPLKAWKESRAKLEAAIDKLDTSPDVSVEDDATPEPAQPKAKPKKKASKKAPKAPKQEKSNGNLIASSTIDRTA